MQPYPSAPTAPAPTTTTAPARVISVHPPRASVARAQNQAALYPELRSMKQRRNQRALTTGVVVGAVGLLLTGPVGGAVVGVCGAMITKISLKKKEARYKRQCDHRRQSEMNQHSS